MTTKISNTYFSIPEGAISETDGLLDVENNPRNKTIDKSFLSKGTVVPRNNDKSLPWRRFLLTFYLLLFPLLAFTIGWLFADRLEDALYRHTGKSLYESQQQSAQTSSVDDVSIEIGNEYGSASTTPTYGVNYPWDVIVEPYKLTYLTVKNPLSTESDVQYRWLLDGEEVDFGRNVSINIPGPAGSERKVTLQILTSYTSRTSSPAVTDIVKEISVSVVVKYVRREIRQLLAQDRVAFFQALSILQRVPTTVGQRLYGDKYFSKDHFNRMHLYFGATRDCDRLHEGPGFISAHMSMTLMFEQALQAINPSIALPYWDFTLESTFLKPDTFRSSIIFSEGWFSEANTTAQQNNGNHIVRRGRFAKSPVMQHAENFSSVVNAYGLLKAPWNSNPAPYLTRSVTTYSLTNDLKPSGCVEYSTMMSIKDFISLAMYLNTEAHGHLHELLGGSWGFRKYLSDSSDLSNTNRLILYQFAHAAEQFSKVLWRANLLECPDFVGNSTVRTHCVISSDSASMTDTPSEDEVCRCQCAAAMYAKDEDLPRLLFQVGLLSKLVWYDATLRQRGISSFLNSQQTGPALPIDGYTEAESLQIYQTIRDYLCDMGVMGDMFQATSTNDMVFWVMHPNMERLWHAHRLASAKEWIAGFQENWVESETALAAGKTTTWASCPGHKSTDPTFLKNVFSDDDPVTQKNIVYTNAALYAKIHPASLSLPYIYDQMTFPHCEALGYNMKGY